MKALVAAACIAVLAFVGYYFLGEYSDYSARQASASAAAAKMEDAREEIFKLAEADPHEPKVAASWCRLTAMRLNGGNLDGNNQAARIVANCKMLGLIPLE
ncbi:hypothetical protein C7441_1259 [Pseudaminobacter salicylatoxidans]|uniref:Uncharacterized protein n=1 Tax=Pseudaminobacter salicylatoxidans TaxID=93369 RepID=A0A316BMP1_PSESE|nr:hypothetical protein [Pseudaminobacter salicylatoxidans]PWJ73826.1 hypothetical protein C7441_1259 [Pseudaminobacter salicylatoxidans]